MGLGRILLAVALAAALVVPTLAHATHTSGIVASATLSEKSVTLGESLTGKVTVKNTGSKAITLKRVVLAARPPGGTDSGGPYMDFGIASSVRLAAGQAKSFTFTRAFAATDPVGDWYAYAAVQLPNGKWQSGARIDFVVAEPRVVVTSALAAGSVALGASLSGDVTVTNAGAAPLTLERVVLAARPPGGSDSGGPYLDFGGVASVRLAPGESRAFTFTRAFASPDPTGSWYAYGVAKLPTGRWAGGAKSWFDVVPAPDQPSTGLVVKATPNGLTVNGAPFLVEGVAYSPVPVGQDPRWGYGWYDWYGESAIYKADLPRIKAMGANTVRVYGLSPVSDARSRAFLDEAHANGLKVIVGDWGAGWRDAADPQVRQETTDRVLRAVGAFKDHPAILMWEVGNEVELNYYGPNLADWYTLLDEIAVKVHALDPNRPVSTASSLSEQFQYVPHLSPNVDVYSVNAYLLSETGLSGWFFPLAASKLPGKPVLVTEFGADAWNTETNTEYGDLQASLIERQWRQILGEHTGGTRKSAGGVVFQWVDEWWKGGEPAVHNGLPQGWSEDAKWFLPDEGFSEEYFGITRQVPGSTERTYRPAYATLKALWS